MKTKTKVIICFFILLLFVCILSKELKYFYFPKKNIVYSEELDKSNLNELISDYIKNNYFERDNNNLTKFQAHKIHGVKKRYYNIYLYMHVMYTSYYMENDEMKQGPSGFNSIVLIIREEKENSYKVISHKEPSLGEDYLPSIHKTIPREHLGSFTVEREKKVLDELRNEIDIKTRKRIESKQNPNVY
ncbi:MAG: hypothetical protein JJT76_19585 [Clostridiaceae bacterium]|nr:hypothetical protein [Clostridiaceae bacterium]